MKTLEAEGLVTPDGHLSVRLPFAISPGTHPVVVVIDEQPVSANERVLDDFPVIDVGAWLEDLSLRREELYGESGR